MKLVSFYPAAWRKRYGDELETLLHDSGAGWRVGFDLLKGALQMRLKFQPFGFATGLILAGTLAGGLMAYLRPQMWEATSVVRLVRYNPTDDGAALQKIVQTSRNALETPQLRISAQPRTEAGSQAMLFSLTATDTDPQKAVTEAVAAANRLAKLTAIGFIVRIEMPRKPFPQRIRDEDRSAGPIPDNYQATVVNPDLLPARPVSPARWFYVAAGFIGGLLLALATFLMGRRTPDVGLQTIPGNRA